MRILAASSFHYHRGGDSSQFLTLEAALEDRGHEVATFSMQHPDNLPSAWERYWVPRVEYRGEMSTLERVRAGARSMYSGESGRRIARLIHDFRPEVVHFHSVQHHLTLSAVRSCVSAGVPVVWTLHDYRSVCPASALLRDCEICERCSGGRFWHGVAGRCKSGELSRSTAAVAESYATRLSGTLAQVDCYVAPSRFLADKVLQMGLPARRLEVLPNPVEGMPTPPDTRDRRGLLYVGRLSAEKGVDCLIEAVAGLSDTPLRVVGAGSERVKLEALASSCGADVDFEGWLDPADVRARMAEAALLCVPSICYENCPGVVLEAMVAGLPVIASDLGGLVELLQGGRAGWLAPRGDSRAWRAVIRRAVDDLEETARRSGCASGRVRSRHDPERFIERVESIYRSVAR